MNKMQYCDYIMSMIRGNITMVYVYRGNNEILITIYLFTQELSIDMRHEALSMSKCSTASKKATK